MKKQPPAQKAVIYARYSSHSQTEQSIEGQLRDCHAWAEQNNVTVIAEYIDRALTGTKDQRPDFQRMIRDAERQQFSIVLVWKLDRFARNRYDSATYKARLKKYGVKVVSVKEAISDAPEGIILEGLLESMAEYYSANLSQNIRRGQRESVAKGLFPGGAVAFGYKVQDRRIVPDPKLVPVVRDIFEKYAAGVPKKNIIDELTARGIRLRTGARMSYSSFSHILSNTTYIGEYVYSGQVVPGAVTEAIIDRDLFDRVQARLQLNARARLGERVNASFLLTGKIFCGICGSTIAGHGGTSHTGANHFYYSCHNHKYKKTCPKKAERRDELEDFIIRNTVEYILTPDCAAQVASAVVAEYHREFSESRADELDRAIKQLDVESEKLVDALIEAPKAAHPKIYARMESIDAQKAELEVELSRLRIASRIDITEAEVRAWLRTFTKGNISDPDFRQRLVDIFINSIYVYEHRIIIFYNIKSSSPHVQYSDLQAANIPENLEGFSTLTKEWSARVMWRTYYIFVDGVFGCIFYPPEKTN